MRYLNKLNITYYYNSLLNSCTGFMTAGRREISGNLMNLITEKFIMYFVIMDNIILYILSSHVLQCSIHLSIECWICTHMIIHESFVKCI